LWSVSTAGFENEARLDRCPKCSSGKPFKVSNIGLQIKVLTALIFAANQEESNRLGRKHSTYHFDFSRKSREISGNQTVEHEFRSVGSLRLE
jgi:hypothetical protein